MPQDESLDSVRKRPSMYIGDVRDGTGLQHVLWELVANTVDQHLAGAARRLSVDLDAPSGGIEVQDDGPGIPLDRDADGVTFFERVFTRVHTTATRDGHAPHLHLTASLFGCGLAPIAAVAKRLHVDTWREGQHAHLAMERGRVVTSVTTEPSPHASGTRISFLADPEIFPSTALPVSAIHERLREVSALLPHLVVHSGGQDLPHGGVVRWVRELGAEGAVLAVRRPVDDVFVDLAIGWSDAEDTVIRSFVNLQRTRGGTHERGLLGALARVARGRGARDTGARLERRLSRGLRAVVHVSLLDPVLDSPTRTDLQSPEARRATVRAVTEAVARTVHGEAFRDRVEERLATSSG